MRPLRAIYVSAALFMIGSLAGCGFTPIYGTGSSISQTLSDIQVAPPGNREEYLFVRGMEERLTRNSQAQKTLRYNLSLSEVGLDIRDVSRSQVIGKVNYQLFDEADGKVLASGAVESFTSFSTDDDFPTLMRNSAQERLINILVDRVMSDLTAKLAMD
ncbi:MULTISPECIES: hypothetical protein [Sulfitobacter]|uniref:LPS-assembly lipoprotein n=1 Tax=Sulfitobacter dubius TaxID=218673 RepID=A0ABY3ZR81_9RHOB|nr:MULTISPECIES: hypothetical protein [Sulfitobacter]UOA16650.1 hypothetical protein DSM109990_03534 [Sulfitobacter dubius]UOA33647.1 hypothetical protein DSM110093_03482 [Sulfitobacter sp. DSM 110093]